MAYAHKHCGGYISMSKRRCTKCGKKWTFFKFWLDPTLAKKHIQIVPETQEKFQEKLANRHTKGSYSSWADRLPGVGTVASILPRWPKWARITTVVVILLIIVGLLIKFL